MDHEQWKKRTCIAVKVEQVMGSGTKLSSGQFIIKEYSSSLFARGSVIRISNEKSRLFCT